MVENTVGIDVVRRAGAAEAAHIGRGNVETGLGKRRDLMSPGIGQFRPAVTENHQRAFALLMQEDLDSID
jgi:hypothetical protein